MIIQQKYINLFRTSVNKFNISILNNYGFLTMKFENSNGIKIQKEISYDFNKLTQDLIKDEYGPWKNMTDKFKDKYFSHDSFLENAEIPKFSEVFYFMFFILERIPSPEEFYLAYLELYCKVHQDNSTFHFLPQFEPKTGERGKKLPPKENLYLNSLKCRITRAYPSFIREVGCLFNLFEQNNIGANFKYNLNSDIHKDSDIVCVYEGNEISISLYNNTSSSLKKRLEKEQNAALHNCDFKIALLANLSMNKNTKNYGSIALYDLNAIYNIFEIIKNNRKGYFIIGSNN